MHIGPLVVLMCSCINSPRFHQVQSVWSVAGREVFTLRASAGGFTPDQRVEALDDRLTEILSKYDGAVTSDVIVLRRHAGMLAIFVKELLLITVTEPDARANNTTRERLGAVWLARVRNTVPQVAPRVNRRGA